MRRVKSRKGQKPVRWLPSERAIVRKMVAKSDWRRSRLTPPSAFLREVQEELRFVKNVEKSLLGINRVILWDLAHVQRKEWHVVLKKELRNQPTNDGIPYAAYFQEELELLQFFGIPLNELALNIPTVNGKAPCPCSIKCSFIRLMGIPCVESKEIYRYALAVSQIIKEIPGITLQGIGRLFVDRHPKSRILWNQPVLDILMRVFCRMLKADVVDESERKGSRSDHAFFL